MNIPTYEGAALAMMARITDTKSDVTLWTYGARHLSLPDGLHTIEELVASGYEQVPRNPGSVYSLCLLSQLYDVKIVLPASPQEQHTMWVRADDMERMKAAPVILAFQTQEIPSTEDKIDMLQFLPLPRLGQWGSVDNGNGELLSYPLTMLPEEAKDIADNMGKAILKLGEPGLWCQHNNLLHPIAANELTYLHYITNYRSILFQRRASKADKADAKQAIQKLEKAHEEVTLLRQSWMKTDWLVQWIEIRNMAQALASAYYAFHQTQVQQPARRDMPAINDTFRRGQATIWSALPFQAFSEAASNAASGAGRWTENRVDETTFRVSYPYVKPSGITTIHMQEEDKDVSLARERAWQQVKAMGDLDGDTYLAMIVQLRATIHNRDKDGWTWVRADKILDYRGIAQKKDTTPSGKVYAEGHRIEDIADIARCVRRMKNTRITVEQAIFEEPQSATKRRKPGKGRMVQYRRESPLFQFGDVITRQQLWNYSDGMGYATTEVAWQVKESAWMEPFIAGTNYMETRLLQSCLNYDPHNEKWEKRLSRYLMFHLRSNGNRPLTRNIGALLEETSLNEGIQERAFIRTKDRFEKALERLKKDGHITRWEYADKADLPKRNQLPAWLARNIIFTAPIIVDGSGDAER